MSGNADLSTTMRATLRECRMVVERLCQSVGVPDGILPSVTNCGVYSAALGLAGFPGMERQLDLVRNVEPEGLSFFEAGGVINVDAAGLHAWVAAEPALDLLVAAFRTGTARELIISDVSQPAELGTIRALSQKHGFEAEVEVGNRTVVHLFPRARGEPTVLDRIICEGIEVERDLWFHLFHRSHDALAPDTVISRTHTGSIIVRPDGTIIGKEDPEFADMDLTMLTRDSLIQLERDGPIAK